MLPVIDAAYKLQIERQRRQLVLFLIIVSLLSVFLIISVVLIYKQVKKLSVARRHLRQANHIKENISDISLIFAPFILKNWIIFVVR